MPNIPVVVDGELIVSLFGAIGNTWRANEKLFDVVTGLSGTGPCNKYLVVREVAVGLPRDLALDLASQTVLREAYMTNNIGKHPSQLIDDVASPGGTAINGMHELEKSVFCGVLMNVVVASTNVAEKYLRVRWCWIMLFNDLVSEKFAFLELDSFGVAYEDWSEMCFQI
uniref:Pyrroline-5-carboxylate reductase dimerisation domain-containing protein n=1 Tax=Nelumbo nucifera TaxID=4432 RepID=A0A822XWL3_NELNU|nr:TPA_asm: hypothetical protein HUJ06_025606 [Nelumbo nucifera]